MYDRWLPQSTALGLHAFRTVGINCRFFITTAAAKTGVPDPPPDVLPTVWDLVPHPNCEAMYTLLAYPGFKHYISKLCRLAFNPEYGHTQTVVFPPPYSGAHSLRLFNHHHALNAAIPLPPLPSLRSLEFRMIFSVEESPFSSGYDFLCSHFEHQPYSDGNCHDVSLVGAFAPPRDPMAILDAALVAHSAARLFDSGSTLLAALGDLLKQAFPEIHALDRIVVEEYRTNREGVAIAPYMNGLPPAYSSHTPSNPPQGPPCRPSIVPAAVFSASVPTNGTIRALFSPSHAVPPSRAHGDFASPGRIQL
ncbi:hypothetical protein B0H14DRAFT_3678326 [Mycena olivaceomarginata]|nr:hypothetical protein B0H14DRAFT_3678326 [Mycena olivaceomarginata]